MDISSQIISLFFFFVWFKSVLFSCSIVSDSLQPHGLQHTSVHILHYFPEPAQTHIHWVGDAIQTPNSLLSPFLPALSLSQHQGLFLWSQFFASGGQSIGVSASASVLPMNIQGWFHLRSTSLILQSKGLSRIFSSTMVWKHQFFSTQPYLWSNCHICTGLLEKP